jgi:ribosome assembly protein 4
MATLPPPPSKRQKTAAAARAAQQVDVEDIPDGSVRIQFVDRTSSQSTGPPVSVPLAHANVKNLELLLNNLQGHEDVDDRIPYRFFHDSGGEAAEALGDGADIYNSLIKKGTTTEEIIVLQYSPQAVFRVRAVARCSATISGVCLY